MCFHQFLGIKDTKINMKCPKGTLDKIVHLGIVAKNDQAKLKKDKDDSDLSESRIGQAYCGSPTLL